MRASRVSFEANILLKRWLMNDKPLQRAHMGDVKFSIEKTDDMDVGNVILSDWLRKFERTENKKRSHPERAPRLPRNDRRKVNFRKQ
jgi:hypothetical protein